MAAESKWRWGGEQPAELTYLQEVYLYGITGSGAQRQRVKSAAGKPSPRYHVRRDSYPGGLNGIVYPICSLKATDTFAHHYVCGSEI